MNHIFFSVSFFLIFSFISFTFSDESQSKAPIIIYLKGTCSAGKSTLIKSLALLRDDIEVIDEDTLVHEAYPKAIADRFPSEYSCIIKAVDKQNLYHVLRTQDIFFKKNVTQEECILATKAIVEIQEELNNPRNLTWKQEVSQNISKEVLNRIQWALKNKKNVLLDAWYVKGDEVQILNPETSLIRVMLYCSLQMAYERLVKRNREAIVNRNLEERRFIGQLLGSFSSLYQINTQPLQPIESMNKDTLDQLFDLIYPMLPEEESPKPIFTLQELSRTQLRSIQTYFMQRFENNKFENFYISPIEKQDLIIDNTHMDLQKAVHLIEDILDGKEAMLPKNCNN